MNLPLFLNLGTGEIFLILIVVLMFFGSNSIPGIARSMGKAVRDFKDAAAGIQREIQNSVDEVKQNTDLDKEIGEIKEASNRMMGHIQEGIDNMVNNADVDKNITTNKTEPVDQITTAEVIDPQPETTAETIAETTTEIPTDLPEQPVEPPGPPKTVKRG